MLSNALFYYLTLPNNKFRDAGYKGVTMHVKVSTISLLFMPLKEAYLTYFGHAVHYFELG